MKRFAGKNIVITGAAGGLGRVLALEYAREGGSLLLVDKNDASATADLVKKTGMKAEVLRCDITKESEINAMCAEAVALLGGRVDVLVNNAGWNGKANLVKDMKLEDWELTLRVNLTGTMMVCRGFIPAMAQRKQGCIVNVSSNVGRRGLPLRCDYVCSKWALLGFTQTLALELVSDGIRVNAVCPGPIEGERIEQLVAMHAKAEGADVSAMHKAWENVPMKRFMKPEEVASVVKFLSCADSSAMTGQALNITGGLIMT